jgi:hypothetical protein
MHRASTQANPGPVTRTDSTIYEAAVIRGLNCRYRWVRATEGSRSPGHLFSILARVGSGLGSRISCIDLDIRPGSRSVRLFAVFFNFFLYFSDIKSSILNLRVKRRLFVLPSRYGQLLIKSCTLREPNL